MGDVLSGVLDVPWLDLVDEVYIDHWCERARLRRCIVLLKEQVWSRTLASQVRFNGAETVLRTPILRPLPNRKQRVVVIAFH